MIFLSQSIRHGTYGTSEALNAGLDLEMPGPPRWRTPNLMYHSLSSQKLRTQVIDERVTALLTFVQKLARQNSDVVYGDNVERSRDSPVSRAFARRLASSGVVVLKNDNTVLPLTPKGSRKIAVIGPNARARVISGGGSAALKPTYVVTPLEGIINSAAEDIEIRYELGCYGQSINESYRTLLAHVLAMHQSTQISSNAREQSHNSDRQARMALLFL